MKTKAAAKLCWGEACMHCSESVNRHRAPAGRIICQASAAVVGPAAYGGASALHAQHVKPAGLRHLRGTYIHILKGMLFVAACICFENVFKTCATGKPEDDTV